MPNAFFVFDVEVGTRIVGQRGSLEDILAYEDGTANWVNQWEGSVRRVDLALGRRSDLSEVRAAGQHQDPSI